MAAKIISGTRTAEDIVRADLERRMREAHSSSPLSPTQGSSSPQPPISLPAALTGDYFPLHNLSCVDTAGNVFEHHDVLEVRTDIYRQNGAQQNFTSYAAIVYSKKQGLFLPSMALSCNIAVALYQLAVRKENGTYTILDQNAKKLLDQYKNKGNGTGWHAQNTVIDYNRQRIIHYPIDADFPTHGGTENINQGAPRTELPFEKVKKNGLLARSNFLRNMTLADGLQDPLVASFVKQLTGLATPATLIEIGEYFSQPAKVWFPTNPVKAEDCTETRAAWFGCVSYYLNLNGNNNLLSNDAARGVR